MVRVRWMVLLGALAAAGCQGLPRTPGPEAQGLASIDPKELRDVLAGLARSHGQKVQLEFYLSLPWKGLDAGFGDFFYRMAPLQAQLDKELRAWAAAHDIDLTYRFTEDVMGQAQKTMEDRQSAVILADNRAALTRDAVIQMYMDYEFQISILQNLLPKVRDAGLRAYVTHSLKVHQDGSAELAKLLGRFKGT